MQGWAGYSRPAIAKNVFGMLDNFTWWRVIRMLRERHHSTGDGNTSAAGQSRHRAPGLLSEAIR